MPPEAAEDWDDLTGLRPYAGDDPELLELLRLASSLRHCADDDLITAPFRYGTARF